MNAMQERGHREPGDPLSTPLAATSSVLLALPPAARLGSEWRPLLRAAAFAAGKRMIDVAGASLLLLVAAPLMLSVAMLVRARDRGPALIRHRRVGRGGTPFTCLKFRSMAITADAILADLLAADAAAREEWSRTRKLRNDPRITPLGRFLRATSIDELPQLFNVLRGEMSLVGPRPVVQAELEEHYGPIGTAHYLLVRPGITGLWQVSGRSDTTYRERVALDIAYVRQRSLLADIGILLRTVRVVLSGRGAC